jgi:hypothetical protein
LTFEKSTVGPIGGLDIGGGSTGVFPVRTSLAGITAASGRGGRMTTAQLGGAQGKTADAFGGMKTLWFIASIWAAVGTMPIG